MDENLIILTGNLTADPVFNPGEETGKKSWGYFSIAVNNNEKADFFQIKVFGKTAESVGANKKKGDKVLVRGSLKNYIRTDDEGNKSYSNEIIASKVQFL